MSKTCIEKALTDRASAVLAVFKTASLTVVTAESCTGGLISAVLSQAKDAGEVLHGSFVAYSKANKTKALGVDAELLKREGSVNSEVVRQLVRGALDRSPADVAVAVRGVLGPSADEDGNPVGLVFFACGRRNKEPLVESRTYGDQPHDVLRRRVVLDALSLLEQCVPSRRVADVNR